MQLIKQLKIEQESLIKVKLCKRVANIGQKTETSAGNCLIINMFLFVFLSWLLINK
jgi:hypothetical protein